MLAERRARWGRRPPLACGGISAGAPGPSSAPRAALALIHSAVPFSAPASFPSRLPARARRPFPCPVLPPPVAFGSGRFPLRRLYGRPPTRNSHVLSSQRPPSLPLLVPGSTPPSPSDSTRPRPDTRPSSSPALNLVPRPLPPVPRYRPIQVLRGPQILSI
ncbi:vegetative cell wall protein gp1-like isoform X2 [Cervus canadensis]|uniref:vegetative cell wall protein gp1-like isoform X2 n=1 Tax=Cervus canadensis TaxID=1574408 RepID=UPI001CA34898|nr:vegetative cell wall protein gp1-like isoform X2 [Cervus canadensis]